MSYPVLKSLTQLNGASFLKDSEDPNKWYYYPFDAGWKVADLRNVSGRTIWNARKEFMPPNDILTSFKNQSNATSLAPVSVNESNNNLVLELTKFQGQSAKLNVLNDVPFPSLTFTATVDNNLDSGNQLNTEIQEKLRSNSIYTGNFKLKFDALRFTLQAVFKINYREFVNMTFGSGSQHMTEFEFTKKLLDRIEDNLSSYLSLEYGQLSDSQRKIVLQIVYENILKSIIARKMSTKAFHDKYQYNLLTIREALELPNIVSSLKFESVEALKHEIKV